MKYIFLFISLVLLSSCGGANENIALDDDPTNTQNEEWLIPLSQIKDGGPGKDGIPSIDNPRFLSVTNSTFLNDTLRSNLLFDNVMAYDDGSAERAYGLNGGGTDVKKFAYEFNIATQDTLAAIQIHFSNVDVNVDNLVFSFLQKANYEIAVRDPCFNI